MVRSPSMGLLTINHDRQAIVAIYALYNRATKAQQADPDSVLRPNDQEPSYE